MVGDKHGEKNSVKGLITGAHDEICLLNMIPAAKKKKIWGVARPGAER